MLEDHERAAMMINEENVTWHRFLRSRFVGQANRRSREAAVSIDIQSATLESPLHAELRGLLELSANSSLPVVFEFVGTLNLETRELLINDGPTEASETGYAGRFSENGRVLTLRSLPLGSSKSREFHLVHEGTLRELFGE